MSTLTVGTISEKVTDAGVAVDGVTLKDGGVGTTSSAVALHATSLNGNQFGGRRNVIINGSQLVAQRSTSVANVGASQGYFCTDRFKSTLSGTDARYTVSQDSDAPEGFSKALKYDVTTADTSVASAEFHAISYRAEGQDIAHFEWGTSNAKQCTFSFYAKATTAQTVVVNFVRATTSGTSRSVSKAFSITTSYQRFTFTIPADTGGDAQVETTAEGFAIHIGLSMGSNFTSGTLNETWQDFTNANRFVGVGNLASSTSNNFFITGIQLEVGSQATAFEHRSFGEERQLCYRYYYQMKVATNFMKVGHGRAYDSNNSTATYPVPVPMRANPTGSVSAHSDWGVAGLSAGGTTNTNPASETMTDFSRFAMNITRSGGGFSAGTIYQVEADNNTNATIKLDAEL